MSESPGIVIERVKVREVTGIVSAGDKAEAAISALLQAGFDRADIDVLANDDEVRRQLGGVTVPAEELPDVPEAPRHAALLADDITSVSLLAIALSAAVGGFGGAIVNGAAGGSWRVGLAAVFIGMALAGGLAAGIARQVIERRRPPLFGDGEAVLWVRARSPAAEEKAQAILLEQAAQAVRVHEIDLDKRFRNVPLSSFLARELVR